jgi:hypothetical protein
MMPSQKSRGAIAYCRDFIFKILAAWRLQPLHGGW